MIVSERHGNDERRKLTRGETIGLIVRIVPHFDDGGLSRGVVVDRSLTGGSGVTSGRVPSEYAFDGGAVWEVVSGEVLIGCCGLPTLGRTGPWMVWDSEGDGSEATFNLPSILLRSTNLSATACSASIKRILICLISLAVKVGNDEIINSSMFSRLL